LEKLKKSSIVEVDKFYIRNLDSGIKGLFITPSRPVFRSTIDITPLVSVARDPISFLGIFPILGLIIPAIGINK